MTPGVIIPVGDDGAYLCVPALTFPQLVKHREKLKALVAANFLSIDGGMLLEFVDIAHEAVQRNHPKMTESELFDLLDLRSAQMILVGLLGSGTYVMPAPVADDEEMQRAAEESYGIRLNGRPADA
jgi:hypothetical protein